MAHPARWPVAVREVQECDNEPVLVALEELAFELPVVDVLLEPDEHLIGVRLRRLAEM